MMMSKQLEQAPNAESQSLPLKDPKIPKNSHWCEIFHGTILFDLIMVQEIESYTHLTFNVYSTTDAI